MAYDYSLDTRYDFITCPACDKEYQRIDFGCKIHDLMCPFPYRMGIAERRTLVAIKGMKERPFREES